MQPQDKISKSSWTLLEVVKDTVSINVTNALRSGQLKIEAAQIEKLLTIIAASADEGYHRGHKSFMKTVEASLAETAADAKAAPAAKKK